MGVLDALTLDGEPTISPANFAETKVPPHVRPWRKLLLPEVDEGFRGMPSPLPNCLEGCRVLLLGCGTGRDAFLAAALAGAEGSVRALDASEEAIAEAERLRAGQMRAFGLPAGNVGFAVCAGDRLPFDDASFDSVIVNPLFSRVDDKDALIGEALRVLVDGGEMYLGSVFANRRLSQRACEDDFFRLNYIAGAPYIGDFRTMLRQAGINDFHYVEKREISVPCDALDVVDPGRQGLVPFQVTYRIARIFKIAGLDMLCEDYGQVVTYKGTAPGCNQFLDLNDLHRFFTDEPVGVCCNTCAFIQKTRFARYFDVEGTRDVHFGCYDYCPYSCGDADDSLILAPVDAEKNTAGCGHCGMYVG